MSRSLPGKRATARTGGHPFWPRSEAPGNQLVARRPVQVAAGSPAGAGIDPRRCRRFGEVFGFPVCAGTDLAPVLLREQTVDLGVRLERLGAHRAMSFRASRGETPCSTGRQAARNPRRRSPAERALRRVVGGADWYRAAGKRWLSAVAVTRCTTVTHRRTGRRGRRKCLERSSAIGDSHDTA